MAANVGKTCLALALVSPGLTVAACRHGGSNPADPLSYSSWLIVEIGGQPTPLTGDLLRDDLYAVDFGPDTLVGYGGCNRFSGSYSRSGDRLQLAALGSTRRACAESIMMLEGRLFEILRGRLRIIFPDRGTLVLSGTTGEVRLRRTGSERD